MAVARALPPGPPAGRTGWEMTAATGVRGLRQFHESGAFVSFRFTEANPEAFRVLFENVARFPGATAGFLGGLPVGDGIAHENASRLHPGKRRRNHRA